MAEKITGQPWPAADVAFTWRRYSKTTTARKDCHKCKASAIMPGQAGWWWRYVPARTRGYHVGKGTESLCAGCASAQGLG